MARSRSRSLPREGRRSPRRSRSRSRSHDRRPSRRSRSRSRSPDDLRRRSRSRSLSVSSRWGNEERHRRRHKKHSKKEKKCHKKHKKDQEVAEEQSGAPIASDSNEEDKVEKENETETAPTDAKSFFEQLQKQEAAKQPVGTVHARGGPAPVSATAISTSDKWECSKAGCGNMNSKHAPACNKCGAMKRLTEWR